jgi:hypothetical protein
VLAVVESGDAAASHHCHEVSPIVGREQCSEFGSGWATDGWGLTLELSAMYARVPVHQQDDTGTVTSATTSATFHSHVAARSAMSAGGLSALIGMRSPHFMLGGEFGIQLAPYGVRSTTQVDGYSPRSSTSGSAGWIAIVAGAHTRAGPLDVGVALAGFDRSLAIPQSLPPGFSLCHGQSGKGCNVVLEQSDLAIEPRLTASAWIDPRTTLGATLGVDVVGGGSTFGITLVVHGAPFDGS